jgi:hypothetical protein
MQFYYKTQSRDFNMNVPRLRPFLRSNSRRYSLFAGNCHCPHFFCTATLKMFFKNLRNVNYGSAMTRVATKKYLSLQFTFELFLHKKTVFRIHDILVWIQIRGSMPRTNGSGCGSGSCFFRHGPSRRQLKTNLNKSFTAYYFFKVLLHHFSKIKSPKEVTKQ